MNMMQAFEKALHKSGHTPKLMFEEMDDRHQAIVRKAFARHLNAMHKTGFDFPDERWLQEYLVDFTAGRNMEA